MRGSHCSQTSDFSGLRRWSALVVWGGFAFACTQEPSALVEGADADVSAEIAVLDTAAAETPVPQDILPDLPNVPDMQDVQVADAEQDSPKPSEDAAPDVSEKPDISSDVPPVGTPCKVNTDCPVAASPCVLAKCSPTTKLCVEIWQDPATACDDGNACTQNDACQCDGAACDNLQCKGGIDTCGCKLASDCDKFDDGNKCNGTWFCDVSAEPSLCKPNPATVVKCPPLFDDPCNSAICSPSTGACDVTPTADDTNCDDGKLCTVGDKCNGGKCLGGIGICECQLNSDCKDDGNLCNGVPFCDKSEFPFKCNVNPGSVVTCSKNDDSICGTNTCDPQTGKCSLLQAPDGGKCDDTNYCTIGDHCEKGKCISGENTCGCVKDSQCSKYEAKNLCLGKLFCNLQLVEPACEINPATVVNCTDVYDTQCAQNQCDPTTGKCSIKNVKEAQPCDDNNVCTPDESCQSGVCISKTNNCACNTNGDCDSKDDGNKCNGLSYCNKAKVPYACETNAATVVTCPSVGDTTCLKNVCQVLTGKCEMKPSSNGLACDADNNVCTSGDVCNAGACVAGANKCECQNDSDCKTSEDGNVCNGTLFCDKAAGKCAVNPNTVVTCSTLKDTECLHNVCQPQTGNCSLVGQKQGQTCNADDNPCTTGDTCDNGKCMAGPNTCSCSEDGDCSKLYSANLCLGKMFCNKAKPPFVCEINPATIVTCGQGNPPMCQKYQCVPNTGQCSNVPVADDLSCDDSKLCTVGDVCKGGKCQPGVNICGCFNDSDCAAQEDNNSCNGTLFCDKTAVPFLCKINPNTVVVCPVDKDQGCLKSQCNHTSGVCGLAPALENAACNDSDACTTNEHCKGGKCTGVALVCNDNNVCTVDDCDVFDGCIAVANPVAACDDGDACTADACDVKLGCSHKALDSGSCDDGDPCSTADSCSGGKCKGKLGGGCDDGNPCTDDVCGVDGKNCTHKPNVAACGDGKMCLDGQCGGCEAFRRLHRTGCEELFPGYILSSDACKDFVNVEREEYEAVAVLGDTSIVAVGAASNDQSNKTAGYVTKFNGGGKLLWEKTFGALGSDRLLGTAAAGNAETVAVGAATTNAIVRPWLLRVASDGKEIYSKNLPTDPAQGGAAKGQFEDVIVLNDGSIVAVGSQQSAATNNAAVVARFDASGGLLWQKVFLGVGGQEATLSQRLYGVRATPDSQGLVVVGDTYNPKVPGQALDALAMRLDLAGNLVWIKTFGGKTTEGFFGLDLASDGAIVAVGVINKASANLPGDGWLVRLDAKGAKLSEEIVATTDNEEFRAVACGSGGACTAVGRVDVDHAGEVGFSNSYDKGHAWAVRWDGPGKMAWNQRYDAIGMEKLLGAAAAPNGDVLAAGDARALDKLDKPDGLLLRIDAKGKDLCACKLFKTNADTPNESKLNSTVRQTDDSVVAVGWMKQADGTMDALLGRWDRNGKVVWQKNVGGSGDEQLRNLNRDDKGVYWAVGSSASGVNKSDGWLVRFDEDGKILSQVSYGGSEDDDFRGISAIPSKFGGGWIVSGGSQSGSIGKSDGWIYRLDGDGKTVWSKLIGTAVDERFNCSAMTGSGTILVGGDRSGVAWIRRLDGNGDWKDPKTAEELYTSYANVAVANGANALPDGGVAFAGRMYDTYPGAGAILVYDSNAVAIKQVVGAYLGTGSILTGLFALPSGGYVAYGSVGGGPEPFTLRLDAAWKIVWSNPGNQNVIASTSYEGGAVTADGSAIFVGQSKNSGVNKAIVVRENLAKSQTLNDNFCKNTPVCATGGCDTYFGCVTTHVVAGCTDGNYCSAGDMCNVGTCNETKTMICDDGNPCTADKCANAGGCYSSPAKLDELCGVDKTCNASGNCGDCPYIRQSFGTDVVFAHQVLASVDAGGGNFAVAGQTWSGCCGQLDGYVAKFDASGKKLWETKTNAANKWDKLESLALLADGGVLVGGWFDNSDGPAPMDGQMMRVDKDGKVVWHLVYNLVNSQTIRGVNVVGNTAYFSGTDSYKAMWGEVDLATGKILWQISGVTGKSDNDGWLDVIKLPDGGWILGGYDNLNNIDSVIQRLDADKKVLWAYQANLPNNDNIRRILLGKDGTVTGLGTAGTNSTGPFAVRLNMADGKPFWQYLPVKFDWQVAATGALVSDGSLLLSGTLDISYDQSVGWVSRIDNNGKELWQRQTTLAGLSGLYGVTPDLGGTWTAQGWADFQGGIHPFMQRFNIDGTFGCAK